MKYHSFKQISIHFLVHNVLLKGHTKYQLVTLITSYCIVRNIVGEDNLFHL